MKFICKNCGCTGSMSTNPRFCPSCGKDDIEVTYTKSEQTSKTLIEECEEMIPDIQAAYKAFLEKVAPYDQKMYTLWQYEQRGIISKADMPKLKLPRRGEALKKYRTCLKEGKEWML